MARWENISEIPLDRPVEIVSCKELVRVAIVRHIYWRNKSPRWRGPDKYGPKRILCRRIDNGGDIWARAWREIE